MGLFDELKKLTQPQDDDSDFLKARTKAQARTRGGKLRAAPV